MLHIVKQLIVGVPGPAVPYSLGTCVSHIGRLHLRQNHLPLRVPERPSSWARSARPNLRTAATAAKPITPLAMPETAVHGLQPQALWDYFYALTQIPRPSKFEDK